MVENLRTVHFDAIRGFRLIPAPSRFARITHGEIEFTGTFKGNNQGFPDRDDFSVARKEGVVKRLAIFGDSFTAGQNLNRNWPDYVEDFANKSGLFLDLLNFSVDGAGLANWWSIIIKILKSENYDIDGIVFAVYPGNLNRRFFMAEHSGYNKYTFGFAPTWDHKDYPKTLDDASKYFVSFSNSYFVPPEKFELALKGKYNPVRFKPYLTYQVYDKAIWFRNAFRRFYLTFQKFSSFQDFLKIIYDEKGVQGFLNFGRENLMKDIRQFMQEKNIPCMVIHIPNREGLLSGNGLLVADDTRRFAQILGAEFIDGSLAFKNFDKEEVQRMFYKYDGHWNQEGSDQFAKFIGNVIEDWHEDYNMERNNEPSKDN